MEYPKHVAIIPDGNRTRAVANNVSIPEAYWISYNRALDMLEYTFENTDIQVFTLRGLSTENVAKRPVEEYDFLMNMYKQVDGRLDEILSKNQINFKWIGNPAGVSEGFKNYLDQKTQQYACDSNKRFVFAVNYGGRDEIVRGIHKLAEAGKDLTQLEEEDLSPALDLGNVPPIELVIRTKGDIAKRTSGFMSRWIGYAELYFTKTMCPELDIPTYKQALERFDMVSTARNFGK